MTVSEKHISAARSLNSLAQECLILDKPSNEAVHAIAAALAAAEREGMRRAAMFAAIHSQYPIENDYDKGYAQGAEDAHDRIMREVNSHIHKKEDSSK